MLTSTETQALDKWIKEWIKTYREYPSLEECVTWMEWQYSENPLTHDEKNLVKAILLTNTSGLK